MKKIYIIHGWGADSSSDWFPWLKKELEARGHNVVVPDMPDTDRPLIEAWVGKLKQIISSPDQDTILIGHSIGCQTILRYLAEAGDIHVGKVILVAPWFNLINLEDEEWSVADPWIIADPWVKTPINFEKVKRTTGSIHALFSDNDSVVPIGDEPLFKELLGANTIIFHNKGHFNDEDGVTQIPEILELIG